MLKYNNSKQYLQEVLAAKEKYADAIRADSTNIRSVDGSQMVQVGEFTIHPDIAENLANLLQAAEQDGITLKGWGYRTHQQQINLRKQHCGTSNYAIYQKPSNQCRPPTATPGSSQHEKGLAIDFNCNGQPMTSSSPCFKWLQANAATYGLKNLKSEKWHWSTTGR